MSLSSSGDNLATVYLGLGTNLGSRSANLEQALQRIKKFPQTDNGAAHPNLFAKVNRASSIYETQPWGYLDQGPFLNQVLEVETNISPQLLLAEIKAAEQSLGREPGIRYGPRLIDIDILFYGDQVIDSPDLTVPHPRLHLRSFVLVPLAELAPGLVHPILDVRVDDLCARAEGKEGVALWGKSAA